MRDSSEMIKDTYRDEDGILRWKSSKRVPPQDCLEEMGLEADDLDRCRVARDHEIDEFLTAYRKQMEDHEHSAEELFEMRAAFGPGAEVVNVITGKKTRL